MYRSTTFASPYSMKAKALGQIFDPKCIHLAFSSVKYFMFLNSDKRNPAEQTMLVFTFKQYKILQFSSISTVFIQISTKFTIYQ